MNNDELNKLMMPFHDGELDPTTAAAVDEALATHPEAQAELSELRLLSALARDAFVASPAVRDVDLSGVYDGVMARVVAEEAAAEAAAAIEGVRVQREAAEADADGLLARVMTWLGELMRFERPLAALATMAALLAVVGGLWFAQRGGDGVITTPHATIASDRPRTPRRAAEGEVKIQSPSVDAIADRGELKVIELDDEDESALVLWHVVDGEGVTLPDGGTGL